MTIRKTVAEVMSPNPISVQPDTPLREVIQLLANNRISGLPVVDQSQKLVGVISESDLMWQESGISLPSYVMLLDSVIYLENPAKYERELHKALGQTAGEVMNKKPPTIDPDQPLRLAARMMHEKKTSRLIVLDADGAVVGILSQSDIIQAMASDQD